MRPSDWFLVDLAVDPTPGDAFGIRALSAKYGEIAEVALEAATGVTMARSSGAAGAWDGDAGDIFRDKSHRMPGELTKAHHSYDTVATALRAWADSVDDTQAQADRGLQQAREATADLVSAEATLGQAELSWTVQHAQQLTYQKLQQTYQGVAAPTGVTMPTDSQLTSNTRSVQLAQSHIASAQRSVADADSRLDAAKRMVLEAKARHDDAEKATMHSIAEAMGQAVKPASIWEAITSSAAWSAIVAIATVVLTIVSIVAIFVGGPLVWALIIAATVILLADALMKAAQGQDMTMTIVLLLVGLIPGGRALTSMAKIADVFRTGGGIAKGLGLVGLHLASVSKGAVLSSLKSLRSITLISTIRTLQKSAHGLIPGVTSVLHSLPAALRDAHSVNPIAFARDLSASVRSDYKVAVDAAWANHIVEVGVTDPAKAAALWQGLNDYTGVDRWENTMSAPGQMFEMGAGGPASNFVLDGGTTGMLNNDLDQVWGGAQVGDSGYGLRSDMFSLMTTKEIPMAHSIVAANPHFGPGGLHQSFVPDVAAGIKNGDIVVISKATGLPLPVTWKPDMNSAKDILNMRPSIGYDSAAGDTIHMHSLIGTPTSAHPMPQPGSLLRVGIRVGDAAYAGSGAEQSMFGGR